jgi:AcrR family transcriptional regulator
MPTAEAAASRRAEQAEATRLALLRAARELFVANGFAATSLEEIVRRSRVTKGALYHHFASKRELFRAVCEQVEREWVDRVVAAARREPDPWRRLESGLDEFLDACVDDEIQQLLLVDAPAVLGSEELHGISARWGVGLLRTALGDAMDAGELERAPVEPLAHLLLGGLNEAGLTIARSPDPAAARAEMGAAVARLVAGLRPSR